MEEHYAVLGLKPGASNDTILEAFRKLTFEFHPNHNPAPESKEKYAKIEAAFEALYDKKVEEGTRPPVTELIKEEQIHRTNQEKGMLYSGSGNHSENHTSEDLYAKWENVFAPPQDPKDLAEWKMVRDEKRRRRKEDIHQYHQQNKTQVVKVVGGMAIGLFILIGVLLLFVIGMISAIVYLLVTADGSTSKYMGAGLLFAGGIGVFWLIRKLFRGTVDHFK